jgi:hypothetical protein
MPTGFINSMLWELAFWHPRASQDPPDPAEENIVNRIKDGRGNMMNDLVARFSRAIEPDIPDEHLRQAEQDPLQEDALRDLQHLPPGNGRRHGDEQPHDEAEADALGQAAAFPALDEDAGEKL